MILDINKQRVEHDYIELYIVETNSGNSYFTNYETSIWFSDRDSPYTRREYSPIPVAFTGFEHRAEGAHARPVVTFSNVFKTLPNITGSSDDLIGKKITRRKTIKKYLPTQSAGTGPAPTELPQQVFIFNRIDEENAAFISYELTSAFDLEGITVPNRFILANICPWLYQGAAPDRGSTNILGACSWRRDNTLYGDSFKFYFDSANRPLISSVAGAIDIPSGNTTLDYLYRKPITLNYSDGGTHNTYEYFQAVVVAAGSPFNAANFRRVRGYTTWGSGNTYRVYEEGRLYNPCVLYDNKIWLALNKNTNVTPGTDSSTWERIDLCGKRLSSCAQRFRGQKFTDQSSVTIPSTEQNRESVLPYGGFPASKRYNK